MTPITEQELRAFVGRNADHYLEKWRRDLNGQVAGYDQVAIAGMMFAQPKTGFNWSAFFLMGLWLSCRKMYAPTLIFAGVMQAETALEEILFIRVLGDSDTPRILGRIARLTIAIAGGSLGHRWHLSHARRVIAVVRTRGLAEDEHLRLLSKRGGASVLAVFGFVLASIAILEALAYARAWFVAPT